MPTTTFFKLNPEKQEKIIACAIRAFADKGYTGTSMDVVAEAAGIAKGALYRYFNSKQDLFMQVVDNLRDDIHGFVTAYLASRIDWNAFDTIRDSLVSIYEFQKRFSVHHRVLCNVLYQEDLDFKGEVLAKFGKLSTQYYRLLLQRGIACGEVRADIDLDAAGFIIQSVEDRFHHGVIMPFLDMGYALYRQPQEVLEEKADQIIEFFRRAFGKARPAELEGGEVQGHSVKR
ncbi:MAG: TetR/AcrR family transcriptional regulator [Candidatus Glassbacteria bacterium]